jgi:hypothetical protein
VYFVQKLSVSLCVFVRLPAKKSVGGKVVI